LGFSLAILKYEICMCIIKLIQYALAREWPRLPSPFRLRFGELGNSAKTAIKPRLARQFGAIVTLCRPCRASPMPITKIAYVYLGSVILPVSCHRIVRCQ